MTTLSGAAGSAPLVDQALIGGGHPCTLRLAQRNRNPSVPSAPRADRLPRPPAPRRRRDARRGVLHGRQRRALPHGRRGARDHRAGRRRAHPPLHPVARHLAAPVVAEAGRATTSTPTASSCARRPTCGSASRPTSWPAARTASRNFLDAREWDYVVGSVHFIARRGGRHGGLQRVGPRRVGREGLEALLRDGRRGGPHRACSTSWPTPTWSRCGAATRRCRAATCAATTSRPSRASSTAAWPSRSRPPGCASRSARSTRRAASSRRRSAPGCRSRSRATPTCPTSSASATSDALELLEQVGVTRALRVRGPRAAARAGRLMRTGHRHRHPPLRATGGR